MMCMVGRLPGASAESAFGVKLGKSWSWVGVKELSVSFVEFSFYSD
jgi:SNF family Na+-dependent transporter